MPNMISLCCGTVPKTIFYHDRDIFDLFRIGCNGDDNDGCRSFDSIFDFAYFS